MFDYGYQFERFWKEVPLKVGKGAAFRAWNNIVKHWDGGEASFADMLVQHLIERKRTDAKWIEGRYIPQPATFLNGHRWEDEYVRARVPGRMSPGAQVMSDEDNKRAWAIQQHRRGLPVPPNYQHFIDSTH